MNNLLEKWVLKFFCIFVIMAFTNQNLRESTIFDLTSDTDIIVGEFGILKTPEEYAKGLSIQTRVMDFLALARLTNDVKLRKAVLSQFKKELSIFRLE